MTLDRGDHGLAEQHARWTHRTISIGLNAAGTRPVVFLHRLEIGAGAERPTGAGEDRHRRVGIGVKTPEGIGERLCARPVDRIGHLWSVDRHDRDRPVELVVDGHPS